MTLDHSVNLFSTYTSMHSFFSKLVLIFAEYFCNKKSPVIEQLSLLSSGKIPLPFCAQSKVMCNLNTVCSVLISKF